MMINWSIEIQYDYNTHKYGHYYYLMCHHLDKKKKISQDTSYTSNHSTFQYFIVAIIIRNNKFFLFQILVFIIIINIYEWNIYISYPYWSWSTNLCTLEAKKTIRFLVKKFIILLTETKTNLIIFIFHSNWCVWYIVVLCFPGKASFFPTFQLFNDLIILYSPT